MLFLILDTVTCIDVLLLKESEREGANVKTDKSYLPQICEMRKVLFLICLLSTSDLYGEIKGES